MSDPSTPEESVLQTDLHIQASYRLTEALVASENRMRRRIELLTEIVFETDGQGVLRFLNRAWSTTLGYNLDATLGTRLENYVVERSRNSFRVYVENPAGAEVREPLEIDMVTFSGVIVTMEMSVNASEAGGMVGTLYNVTQRNHAQAELAKLSLVASSTDNFVIITNAVGEIEWVNQAFTQKTGFTMEVCSGIKPGRLLHGPQTDPETIKKFSDAIRAQRSFHCEILNYTKSGQEYWVAIFVTPIFDPSGRLERFVSVQNDITVVRQMQDELRVAKDAAERASQAKSVFLAAMSHEIRTPLNGVLGMVALLQAGSLDETQRQKADIIKKSGEALVTIVNDILDYSKIEAGRFSLNSEQFRCKPILDETVSLFRGNAESQRLALSGSFIGDESVAVVGDRGRLRRVLMNLVSNAVKFTPRGGVHVEMRQERVGNSVELRASVFDTGIGVAEKDLDRLFVHFSQVDESATRKQGGTGLGLAISKQLIEMMEGEIGVETKQGEGSTFWFSLRLPCAQSVTLSADTPVAPDFDFNFKGLRALVAEDNIVNQLVLKGVLDSLGLETDMVENGLEAVANVEAGDYDVVLMDIHMPEMDGIEATRIIRLASRVPIIAVTANVQPEHIKTCYECGMNGFVPKPISHAMIESELAKVLAVRSLPGLDSATAL